MWHVSFRSGETNCCKLLYTVYFILYLLCAVYNFRAALSSGQFNMTDRQTDGLMHVLLPPDMADRMKIDIRFSLMVLCIVVCVAFLCV